MNLWAVIPSRDRPEMLQSLIDRLVADGVHVVVVDTGYPLGTTWRNVYTLRDATEPPNISRWWNAGLDLVEHMENGREHTVALLNDDLVVPPGFMQTLAQALADTGAAAAYPDQHGMRGQGQYILHDVPIPISLYRRMTGYAFALRGSAGIRADETLQWWYGDDDIDWTARQRGGSVLVGGLTVQHLQPNSTTVGELAEQAGRDRETFINKWGRAPW